MWYVITSQCCGGSIVVCSFSWCTSWSINASKLKARKSSCHLMETESLRITTPIIIADKASLNGITTLLL